MSNLPTRISVVSHSVAETSNRVMSLPMSPYLSEADQDVVVAELLNTLEECS